MMACYLHPYRVRGCPDCQALSSSVYLRGLRRDANEEVLEKLKKQYQNRGPMDEPDWLTEAVGEDGGIVVRPMTFDDVAAWVERVSEGEIE